MTIQITGKDISDKLETFADSIKECNGNCILIDKEALPDMINFLKDTPELDFNFLNHITAVDYMEYFEVVYQLTSLRHNHSVILKTRCYGRDDISIPSIAGIFQAADPQEREIYDLMGIKFEGHPNMTRIFLWEGFEGHPLRRDYLNGA